MNKKIALSGLSIVAALTLMGGATFAAFTATASATNSTFSTGSDSLLISDNQNSGFATSITSPFIGSNITPGFTQVYNFYLQNNGTDNLSVQATFANGSANPTLDGVLMTQFSCTDNSNVTTPSAFSVTSMRGGSVNLGTVSTGNVDACTLTVTLPSSADNTVSSQNTSFDVVFNATQTP